MNNLKPGDTVWIPEHEAGGTVVRESNTRSYVVQTDNGTFRRNRRDLILMPNEAKSQSSNQESPVEPKESQAMNEDGGVKTRSGRVSRPPDRLYVKSDNKN